MIFLDYQVARENQAQYVETDPFFNWAEEAWIIPCQAKLPKPLHGLCMYGPAFAVMLTPMLLQAAAMIAPPRLANACQSCFTPKPIPQLLAMLQAFIAALVKLLRSLLMPADVNFD